MWKGELVGEFDLGLELVGLVGVGGGVAVWLGLGLGVGSGLG